MLFVAADVSLEKAINFLNWVTRNATQLRTGLKAAALIWYEEANQLVEAAERAILGEGAINKWVIAVMTRGNRS
jgi:hypothetical protein